MTKYDLLSSATTPITLRVIPELAEEIGLNSSLVLLQLAFWIKISDHQHDGAYWTFQSLRDMQRKAFPFWSHMTIQRAIETLVERKLLIVRDDLNRLKYDNTRWFAINPEGFKSLESVALAELTARAAKHVTGVYQDVTAPYQDVTTIPEITPEITPSIREVDFTPTEQQQAVGALARFYEASCHQMLGGGAQREMNRIAEDYTLAQIEQAVLAIGEKELERPFQYLRRVLSNNAQMALAPPSQPIGPWGRELT